MSDLRKQVEALVRHRPTIEDYEYPAMEKYADGEWISREDVLALLPAEPEPPKVCPSCKRVIPWDKAQGATTFCVDPWHE